jgi:hypothetical protein
MRPCPSKVCLLCGKVFRTVHDDWGGDFDGVAIQFPEDLKAGEIGHGEIEKDSIEMMALDHVEGIAAIVCLDDVVAKFAKRLSPSK